MVIISAYSTSSIASSSMSPSTSARLSPLFRDTPYIPTAPIPIPRMRRVTDPPPRSPTRLQSSPDLIFEMSPHVSNEIPLVQRKNTLVSNNADTYFARKSALPSASRLGCVKSPYMNLPPYWEEPFLYSIPKIPTRPPFHSRTRSAVTTASRHSGPHECLTKEDLSLAFSSTISIKSLSSTGEQSASCSDTSNSDHDFDEVLTTAFQQSFTSTTSSERAHYERPLSPPASFMDEKGIGHPIRMPVARKKRNSAVATVIPPAIRTSVAEPVVSFAQAELKHSPSSGMIARVVKTSKDASRSPVQAYSPHLPPRGRRRSILRTRSLKVSDEDLVQTFDRTDSAEKLGFEKFLPAALQRRRASDENRLTEELPERGRTKSRTRPGRWL